MQYLLLTGATGLLGRYLTSDLLASGNKLALLVRGSKRDSAHQRVEALIQFWEQRLGKSLPRPVVLEGDIRQPLLGLDDEGVQWVARNCQAIVHSAASLKFHDDGCGEPWLSNIDGTRHVLSLCEAANVRRLHYVSTAYVCGLRDGTIYESELDCGQEFRNDYEQSKLQAEKLVRSAKCLDQLTVYRPAVISGDSQTGYTNTYHGIYLYLRMMALIVPRQPVGPDGRRHTPLRLPMTGDERRNVVPVDWVSQVMCRLITNPEAHGRTYHLAPQECVTPGQGILAGYSYYNSTGVQWAGHQTIDPATYNNLEAEILPALTMYTSYERTDPTFDCQNVQQFASDIPCPVIDQSVLKTYIRYGEEDRWGKRREPRAHVERYVRDIFQKLTHIGETSLDAEVSLALDISGQGGGQWTLHWLPNGELAVEPGLIAPNTLALTVDDFFERIDAISRIAPHPQLSDHLVDQFFSDHFGQLKRARA